MTTQTHSFACRFGGWLSEQPPTVAWTILGGVAVIGVALTVWSYHTASATIPRGKKAVLGALRVSVWLGLLLILAAPTRIERVFETTPARPMAVLVDHSGSMKTTDNRQRRRIDDALLRWRDMEPAARRTAAGVKFFAFTDHVTAIPAADAGATLADGQTNLFSSVQRVLTDAPSGGWGGIVTLTDGLDTADISPTEGLEATVRPALAANTPLFFVPGRNRYAGGAFFTLREFAAPTQTAPRSVFHVEATFDTYQAAAGTIDVQMTVNGVARPAAPLRLEAGRRLATWSADVQAQAPGVMELELKVGSEIARTAVRVEVPPTNRILYFQGALDWGYRFLSDIMKRDAAFTLTPVFNFPNPKALLPPGALAKMPATAAVLAGFDIVVLANAAASQFSFEQQRTLSDWVRDGGVLLFLTPDDDSTQGFSGSEMEKMLPVVFQRPEGGGTRDDSGLLSRLRSRTRLGSGGSSDTPLLTPYAWEDSARVREIFAEAAKSGGAAETPVFSAYAHVARAKPGAEVLARHPEDVVAGTTERSILLAMQRYGRGQSAVLTTDALWRWKLNQPSTGRGAELFWQNLFAWMSRDRQHGLRFDHAPLHAAVGRELGLRLEGAGDGKLSVSATLGQQNVVLTEGPPDGPKRVFRWTPTTAGFWQVTAKDASGREARHWLRVDTDALGGEYSGMASNEELLRTLAARTGGKVLEKEAPPEWRDARASSELLAERQEPVWHRGWVFGTLLGLYAVELLLRRKWHLL